MANEVNLANFLPEVLQSTQTVVVDFYATWCPPCQRLAPVFDAVAKDLPQLKFVKVNIDDNHELAIEYGVSSIPTLIIFRQGKVLAKEFPHGFTLSALRAQFERYL